jgi:hypothetical protein
MIAQFSDQSTALAPQLQGKARSATQASVVDREISQDLKISSMSEEIDVLIPMCHITHSMLQQFQKGEDQIRVQGPEFGSWIMDSVKPEDLVGEVDFIWQGSTVAEKTAVRNQQLMSFFQLAVQASSTLPQMQGKIDIPVSSAVWLKKASTLIVSRRSLSISAARRRWRKRLRTSLSHKGKIYPSTKPTMTRAHRFD